MSVCVEAFKISTGVSAGTLQQARADAAKNKVTVLSRAEMGLWQSVRNKPHTSTWILALVEIAGVYVCVGIASVMLSHCQSLGSLVIYVDSGIVCQVRAAPLTQLRMQEAGWRYMQNDRGNGRQWRTCPPDGEVGIAQHTGSRGLPTMSFTPRVSDE